MGIQFLPAGVAVAATGTRTLASRAANTASRMFRGGSKKKATTLVAPEKRAGVGERVADLSRKAVSGTANTALSVGTFIAADALLSEEDLAVDAEVVEEDVRPSDALAVYEPRREPSLANTSDPRERETTADRVVQADRQLERELIAYAAEMVVQKVDASPLLDQVSFLTNRYQLSHDEAFDIAGGVQMYRFHPEVIAIVTAVNSFNTRGTLLLGAQRANRGV